MLSARIDLSRFDFTVTDIDAALELDYAILVGYETNILLDGDVNHYYDLSSGGLI